MCGAFTFPGASSIRTGVHDTGWATGVRCPTRNRLVTVVLSAAGPDRAVDLHGTAAVWICTSPDWHGDVVWTSGRRAATSWPDGEFPFLSRSCTFEGMTAFILNVTFDSADPRAHSAFWSAVTGYQVVTEQDDFVALEAPDERGVRRILFFRVPEPKTAKSRMHVDLATKEPAVEIERLVELGATRVEHREGNGTRWTVMLDPQGNEFCIG
jgi:hypothetical protein